MRYLMKQGDFEKMIGRAPLDPGDSIPKLIVVYFTATWCGPCRAVRPAELESGLPMVTWLKCDIDQNDYTAGYCGVRSIPTFLVIENMQIRGKFSGIDTESILENVRGLIQGSLKMEGIVPLVLSDEK